MSRGFNLFILHLRYNFNTIDEAQPRGRASSRGLRENGELAHWRAKHARVRAAHGLDPCYRPWTSQQHVQLRGLPDSERYRDILDIGFAIMQKRFPGRSTSQVAKGLWASPSQCVSRSPWSYSLATPTTSLEIYSYEKDWVLSGDSMLRLLGWPENRFPVEMFSNHELRCLSGESFSIPIVTQLIMAFYLNPFAPWWQE